MRALTSLRDISRLRLRAQRVEGDRSGSPAAAVGHLLAVQSQEVGLARWSVGMRTADPREAAVEDALAKGQILRTHALRPTWHYVLPADIRWLMRLTAPRVKQMSVGRMRELALDDTQINAAYDIIRRSLEGGRHVTRAELADILRSAGVAPDGQRFVYILMNAELDLVVASGTPRGKKETYALLAERAPGADAAFERDEALATIARRFYASHGPATIQDLTWWSSLTAADVRRGVAANETELEKLTVEGTDYWWAGGIDAPEPEPRAHLLQAYDELIVGYRSPRREINLDALAPAGVLPRPSFHSSIMLDGQVIGFWRRAVAGDGFLVETRPARELSRPEASAVREAVERYGSFLSKRVEHQ